MKTQVILFLIFLVLNSFAQEKIKYPITQKLKATKEYSGIKVEDPYHWLEYSSARETKEWIKAENKLTSIYLKKLPYREKIKTRLMELANYPDSYLPVEKIGENILSGSWLSDNGKYLAYVMNRSLFGLQEVLIKNTKTGQLLPDHINGPNLEVLAWYGTGFYYSTRDLGNQKREEFIKVFHHRLGTSQSHDQLIYRDSNSPEVWRSPEFSKDRRFLFLYIHDDEGENGLDIVDLSKSDYQPVSIIESGRDDIRVLGNIGDKIYIELIGYAFKSRWIKININKPEKWYWTRVGPFEKKRIKSTNIFAYDPPIFYKSYTKFNLDDYQMNHESFNPELGTVELAITFKKGIKMDGKNPTLMFGTGKFIENSFYFETFLQYLLEQGVVVVKVGLFSWDEGEWYKDKSEFDQFIDVAEYLISKKYTSAEMLACMGLSDGALLVGNVINQKPDLFKVAILNAGLMDLPAYQNLKDKDSMSANSQQNKQTFEYLIQQSPYQNITRGSHYPAILATAGPHDYPIPPWHTFKYMARMQEYNAGKLPTLVNIDTNDHLRRHQLTKVVDEMTDFCAFLFYHLGVKVE